MDPTSLLKDVDKNKVYENLAKVLPKMLEHKYQVQQAHNLVRENIALWEKQNEQFYKGDNE